MVGLERASRSLLLADSRGSPWSRIAAVGKRGSFRKGQLVWWDGGFGLLLQQ